MEQSLIGIEIVERIADREGVDPVDLDILLHDVIDPDALKALTNGARDRQSQANLRVEFTYYGYAVTVDGDGGVSIDEQSMEANTNESVGEVSNDSQEDISAELDHRESALSKASETIADRDRPFTEQVDNLLEVVREAVGVDYATLSYVDEDSYVFEAVDVPAEVRLKAGETAPLGELPNCKTVVETEQALVLEDVEADAPELADPSWGISSYLGVPVYVDDEVYGTFCFYGTEARAEEFSEWDLTFVELLSNWVSAELEQRERKRSLRTCSVDQPFPAN